MEKTTQHTACGPERTRSFSCLPPDRACQEKDSGKKNPSFSLHHPQELKKL